MIISPGPGATACITARRQAITCARDVTKELGRERVVYVDLASTMYMGILLFFVRFALQDRQGSLGGVVKIASPIRGCWEKKIVPSAKNTDLVTPAASAMHASTTRKERGRVPRRESSCEVFKMYLVSKFISLVAFPVLLLSY